MKRFLRAAAHVALVLGVASQAWAGDKVWSVPGVVNNGVATVFSCTNRGTGSANVTVNPFLADGTAGIPVAASIPVNGTNDFVTKSVTMLPGATNLGSPTLQSGSATITAPTGVFCSAYVVDHLNDPPTVAWSLKVIKKTSQKGD